MRRIVWLFVASAVVVALPYRAYADEITDWNKHMFDAAKVTPSTSPLVITRNAAMVQAAVFDAVNGIERTHEHALVAPAGPASASARAAAVEAAWVLLTRLYSGQAGDLLAKRNASLAAIALDENPDRIEAGQAWGALVAGEIWDIRSTDGFTPAPPAFNGGTAVGQWRPTPPGFLSGAGVQFSYMTPWVMKSPSQFRPDGPPALDSKRYTNDFNETRTMTDLSVANPSSNEAEYSRFWAASTASQLWDSTAVSLALASGFSLSENARMLALLNLSMADAAIGCWDAKYVYVFWRPITAIPLADSDGNPDTVADGAWTTLITTPNHPEYPSGHSCISGAAGRVLSRYFGDKTDFQVVSNVAVGGVFPSRSYQRFSEALEEVKNARIFSGIHFRSATEDGEKLGKSVANFVLSHALKPGKGRNH